MKKLQTDIKKVNKIFQLSDIHIRLYKRKDEYEQVFSRLYLDIKNRIANDDIILLTGDIVHTKTEMSPEMIDLVSNLLNSLADIAPLVVVPGNHDANLNNLDRMDAIQPIVNAIKHPNLFYIKDTGLYKLANLTFSIMGIFHKKDKYITADLIPSSSDVKIAVYHGVINGCKLDTGFVLKDDKMELEFFDGFDFAMCGDIHKRQILQEYNAITNKPYVAYPGSLIQQTHGESLDKHGYLIWDINSRSYEEVDIKNEYGYMTMYITDGVIDKSIQNIFPHIPNKPRIRLKLKNTTSTELKKCLIDIRQTYNPIEVTYAKNNDGVVNTISSNKLDFSRIRDVSFQNELLKEYLTTNYKIDDDTLNKVYQLNADLNSELPILDIIRNIVWKPIKFEFSNMFSYGENNVINFEKIGGIAGIFNSNASGKSALLESLTYCLFDKCSKAFKAVNVMNNRKNKFSCKLEFEIDGIRYFIEKTAKRGTSGSVPVKINFWKLDDNGNEVMLNGDQRNDTNSVIRSYIGTYDDFILTAIQSQKNPANFIGKTNTERKDLLLQFMDVTLFEKLYDLANTTMKEYTVLLKQFEKRDFDDELLTLNNESSVVIKKRDQSKLIKDNFIKEKELNDSKLIDLAKKLVEIKLPSSDLETLKDKEISLKSAIIRDTKDKESLILEETSLSEKLDKANVLFVEYEKLDIKNRVLKNEQYNAELSKVTNKLEALKISVKNKLDKSSNLLKLEYDPDCKFCMNNIFVKDAIRAQEELKRDQLESKELLSQKDVIEMNLKSLGDVVLENTRLNQIVNLMDSTKNEILKTQNKSSQLSLLLTNKRNELDKVTSDIDRYAKSKELILSNKKIEDDMSSIRATISDYKNKIAIVDSELGKLNSQLAIINSKIKDINEEIENFKIMEEKFGIYEKYLSAMHRDSIPHTLINLTLPAVEEEVNNILSQIVEFSIMLEMDDKNINVKIVYDDDRFWTVELSSGMESFITGIAIRMALINISSLPRPNFMAIDEGFSSLDADNMANLPMLFDYLKSQLGFVLIISHIDHIRDFVDLSLDLQKKNDYSEIVYN